MAETNLKPGDFVQLKSGGPKMTVRSVSTSVGGAVTQRKERTDNFIVVDYFNDNNQQVQTDFMESQLIKIDN